MHDDHDHDDRDRRPHERPGPEGRPGPKGPPGTQFLDLELSKVLASEAEGLVREAARDLLREALRARIKERLGEHLEAIAHLAADSFVDDVLANLEIERIIDARRRQQSGSDERLREITAKIRRPG